MFEWPVAARREAVCTGAGTAGDAGAHHVAIDGQRRHPRGRALRRHAKLVRERPDRESLPPHAHVGKVLAEHRVELGDAEFVHMKRIRAGALSGLRVGVLVRRRDHEQAAGCQHASDFADHLRVRREVFDGLERDDNVDGRRRERNRLARARDEAHARHSAVVPPCRTRRRDVDVDADDGTCAASQNRRPVSLPQAMSSTRLSRTILAAEPVALQVLEPDGAGQPRDVTLASEVHRLAGCLPPADHGHAGRVAEGHDLAGAES